MNSDGTLGALVRGDNCVGNNDNGYYVDGYVTGIVTNDGQVTGVTLDGSMDMQPVGFDYNSGSSSSSGNGGGLDWGPNPNSGLSGGNNSRTWTFVKTFFTTLPSTGPGSCLQVALDAVKAPLNAVQSTARNVTKYVPPAVPTLPFGGTWLGSQISRMVAAGAAEGEALGDAAILGTAATAASEAAPAVAGDVAYGAAFTAEVVGGPGAIQASRAPVA